MFPLKSVEFAKSLVVPVVALLAARPPMAPLDGEHSRGKMVFHDGVIFDFVSGEARKVTAADRQMFRVKFPFEPWQPSNDLGVFSKIETWIKENCNQKSACFENTELGRTIIEDLTALARECEVLAVLRGIWDWETVLHFGRSLTATALATCEKNVIPYFFGPPLSSKDVVAMLAYTFLSGDQDGYAVCLNGSYATGRTDGSGDAATPQVAACQKKRLVLFSEVPDRGLRGHMLKMLCEHCGVPATSRQLCQQLESWISLASPWLTSNFTPSNHFLDEGLQRRLDIFEMSTTHSALPEGFQGLADDALKPRVCRGFFNQQLLWLVKGLAGSVQTACSPGTRLLPRPPCMVERDSAMQLLKHDGRTLQRFVEEECDHDVHRSVASGLWEFRMAAAKYLGGGTTPDQVMKMCATAGLKEESRGALSQGQKGRVYIMKSKTGGSGALRVRVKENDLAQASAALAKQYNPFFRVTPLLSLCLCLRNHRRDVVTLTFEYEFSTKIAQTSEATGLFGRCRYHGMCPGLEVTDLGCVRRPSSFSGGLCRYLPVAKNAT